jgi:hypothetical protein
MFNISNSPFTYVSKCSYLFAGEYANVIVTRDFIFAFVSLVKFTLYCHTANTTNTAVTEPGVTVTNIHEAKYTVWGLAFWFYTSNRHMSALSLNTWNINCTLSFGYMHMLPTTKPMLLLLLALPVQYGSIMRKAHSRAQMEVCVLITWKFSLLNIDTHRTAFCSVGEREFPTFQ